MRNGDVIKLYETLDRISANKELKFNVKVGYILAKNKEKLRQEAIIIYNERRKIILEYGNTQGNDIIVPKDKIDEVNSKLDDLFDIENDVEIIQLPLEAFEDYELNMEDIEGLEKLFYPIEFTGPPIYE